MAERINDRYFLRSLILKGILSFFAVTLFACQASKPENQEPSQKRPSLDGMLHATCALYGDWQYPCEKAGFSYNFSHFHTFKAFVNDSCLEGTRYIAWMNKVDERRAYYEEQFSLCTEAMNKGYAHIKEQAGKNAFWQIDIQNVTDWDPTKKTGQTINTFDGAIEAFFDENGKMLADKYGRTGARPYRGAYMEERYSSKNPIYLPLPDNDQP